MTRRTAESLSGSTMSLRPAPTSSEPMREQRHDAPSGSLSSYMLFANDEAPKVRAEFPGLKFGEVSRILGQRWWGLTDDERAPYDALAEVERKRLEAETQSHSAPIKPEEFTKPFCDFLTENPTIFHTVDHFRGKLGDAGYKEVSKESAQPPM